MYPVFNRLTMKSSKTSKLSFAFTKFSYFREFGIFLILILLSIIFYFTSRNHSFVSQTNVGTMLKIGPEIGIIAIGVTVLMIAGEFDLSVGSMLGFAALVMCWLYSKLNLNLPLAFFITLCVGAFMGALNGLITVKFGIPSFITTLGTMMWWRGMIFVISAGFPTIFRPEKTNPLFKFILAESIGGIPLQFIWFVVFTIILTLLLNYHKFGNHVFATGGNKEAARAMGVNTDLTKIICFIIVGILSAFCGVIQSTRARGAYALQGTGAEMQAIAATVIGGTSLFGGSGTIIGTFLGTLVLEVISSGLLTSGVSGYWFNAVVGITVITIVIMNVKVEQRRMRRQK